MRLWGLASASGRRPASVDSLLMPDSQDQPGRVQALAMRAVELVPNRLPAWAEAWLGRVSLANKCLLLFGSAVVLIVAVALTAPWLRMNGLVDAGQREVESALLEVWNAEVQPTTVTVGGIVRGGRARVRFIPAGAGERAAEEERLIQRAARALERNPAEPRAARTTAWEGATRVYRSAVWVPGAGQAADEAALPVGLAIVEWRSDGAIGLLAVNALYVVIAGVLVLGLATVVFYSIIHRIILSPVRTLKATAQRVREGDLSTRSDIRTGDEFAELAETFNLMLGELQTSQDQLRSINAAMDMKLSELAESNVALFEAAKLKGDFLASVSHELRTPLNSIIGFAELLLEIAQADHAGAPDDPAVQKRERFLRNIVDAGKSLLSMIESLLEMAKIEAGRVDIDVERVDVAVACEPLLGLIHPLAHRKGISVSLDLAPALPKIETDVKKFQQVLFNFLSNAVKFTDSMEKTGRPGLVVLRAEHLPESGTQPARVRLSVIDTGPGIAKEEQDAIFEKFRQLDGGHTREQGGTGLGLSISRELAKLIQGEIQVVSDVGRGSMFSLVVPVDLDRQSAQEAQLEAAFRGTLTGRRGWTGRDVLSR